MNSIQARVGARKRSRAGTACVEFACVAPFLLFLIFGSIEFARMIMVQQALTNAAREGCRAAATVNMYNLDSIEDRVRENLKGVIAGNLNVETVRISCTPSSLEGITSGTTIALQVEVDCEDVSWIAPMFFVDAKLSSAAKMKRE